MEEGGRGGVEEEGKVKVKGRRGEGGEEEIKIVGLTV